ncbi:hypothetical protein [Aquimarina hainanensis]|uniref:hypothetical protein n=1 Tax=Aquimarina hainanensis TaxID=1578017 RepID=UPI003608FFEA
MLLSFFLIAIILCIIGIAWQERKMNKIAKQYKRENTQEKNTKNINLNSPY